MIVPIAYILIIIAAFGGILLTMYLRHKKQTHETMVCPLHADCQAVIQSEYSHFIGVPVELLGMLYYGAIAVSYALITALPFIATPTISLLLIAASASAFLFSLYLIFIQAFYIKQWCSWCLISAGLSTLIFALAFFAQPASVVTLLALNTDLFSMMAILGLILGVGGVTIMGVLFFKFLKDFRISSIEADIIRTLGQVTWLGLGIVVLAMAGLATPFLSGALQVPSFIIAVVVLTVIVLNDAFLYLKISPNLIHISFGNTFSSDTMNLYTLRRTAFAMGGVSLVSWYTLFYLLMQPVIPFSSIQLLMIYIALIVVTIIASQLIERGIARKV